MVMIKDVELKESLLKVLSQMDSLSSRIERLESRMKRVPSDFTIRYKPPGEENYKKLDKVLDALHINQELIRLRLNTLEDAMD